MTKAGRLVGAMACLCLIGCAAQTPAPTPPTASEVPPVTVTSQALIPTVSVTGQVVATPSFRITAPEAGEFSPADLEPGALVAAGTTLGSAGDSPITLPVDVALAQVLATEGDTVPEGMPLFEVQYGGFAMSGQVDPSVAWMTLPANTTGKAQIDNGPAPFVTHDQDIARRCDRVGVMDHGRFEWSKGLPGNGAKRGL